MLPGIAFGILLAIASPAVRLQTIRVDQDGNPTSPVQDKSFQQAVERVGGLVDRMQPPMRPPPAAPRPERPAPAKSGRDSTYLLLGALLICAGAFAWARPQAKPSSEPPPPAGPPLPPGMELSSNFAITRLIGRGGMACVYEAVDRTLQRRVAIKKIRDDMRLAPGESDLFLKEARTVASLRHPNIVDIHSVVAQGPDVFIVFEYVEGKTLQAILRERGRLSLKETKAVLLPVCAALDYAHDRQVIHRDLKPGNIMINKQGAVKVMDFGIARRIHEKPFPARGEGPSPSSDDSTVHTAGTPFYMAPEAAFGFLCRESDIYALGLTAYEMLAGVRPFSERFPEDPFASRDYPRLSTLGLPAALDPVIGGALQPDYRLRIHTAGEFRARLAAV
jgi:serine/threonine-protein kinase